MRHKKIIVWGVKLDTGHTHSHIHAAFVRAAQYLGHEVYWLDDRDNVDDSFFDDSLILSEHSIATTHPYSRHLPLRMSSTYIMNCLGNKKDAKDPGPGAAYYLGRVGRIVDFRFRFDWSDSRYEYKFEENKYTPVHEDRVSFIEFGKDCNQEHDNYYSLWGTDLLPSEINLEDRFIKWETPEYAFFSGTIRKLGHQGDNLHIFERFLEACRDTNTPFIFNDIWSNLGMSPHDLKIQTQKAFLAVELRPPDHIKSGHVPCRNFKNISYGQLAMTNSLGVYNFFDKEIAFDEDPYKLFFIASEMRRNPKSLDLVLNQMIKVKEKHTHVHRMRDFITVSNM